MGDIAVALLELAALPVVWLFGWVRFLNNENPRKPGMRKGSHGAGLLALCGIAYLAVNGAGSLTHFVGPVLAPYAGYIRLAWVIAAMTGGWLLRTGYRAVFPKLGDDDYAEIFPDPVGVTVPALVKIGLGFAVYVAVFRGGAGYVPVDALAGIAVFRYMAAPYADWAVWAVIVWCVVTGSTKIILVQLARPRRKGDPAPAPADPLHGKSDFATASEAVAAMKGQGNMSSMEKEMF
jgi:hypothetical protein